MEFILDFQGFKSEKNEFIIKELAIISTDDQVYELHLFKPPCSFHQLPQQVRKQVIWLETHFHGLFWNSGYKDFSSLQDVLTNVFKFGGKVYVKGTEKCSVVRELLSSFGVCVINFEDMDCPSLGIIKQRMIHSKIKPCPFDHPIDHCAYCNVQWLLEWWKIEKLMLSRMLIVNLAIKECFSRGYKNMSSDLVKHLPRDFILNYHEDLDIIYEKLPQRLKDDEELKNSLRCNKHYDFRGNFNSDCWDGKSPKRKHCPLCIANSPITQQF